jgi:hypothetical protein
MLPPSTPLALLYCDIMLVKDLPDSIANPWPWALLSSRVQLNLYGLTLSLAYTSGEEGDYLLVHRHGLRGAWGGGRVSTL